ncbi:hypothetical protein AAFC00_000801 [Neodothiora populina]|uniref:Transaldolase n=1 Tax=Neodothiora populina TaxID=2781224 RepID=A0ABR3PLS2_9PEZI
MGVATKRPPLPAPTEDPTDESVVHLAHMDVDDSATDLATNVSRRTDATSYTVPEDGRSITIPTDKRTTVLGHGRNKSQTSLLIEYFEASKNGGSSNGGRPSVRVKVTPSSKRKNKSGSGDAVQITGIGKDRKPSYTRRISLGSRQSEKDSIAPPIEGTELSHSSESNLSNRPPVEVEILNNGSDLSSANLRLSRDLQYMTNPSDISSMPPDSLLDASDISTRPRSPLIEQETKAAIDEHLRAPSTRDRSRSISRERITQKVMEKLKQRAAEKPVEYEPDNKPSKERRRRSSRSHHTEESMTNTESSFVSSSITPSYRSGATSKVSLNNPKLLEMVEDTVRRLILPEINQLKSEKRTERNLHDFESGNHESYIDSRDSYSEDLGRRLSKSSSSPNISSKPKVVLNRYDDDPGEVLSRGDSERRSQRKKHRKSSRESVPTSSRSERRSSRGEDESSVHEKTSKDSHRARDAVAAGIAGGVLTAAALRHHDSRDGDSREKRKKRASSKSHGSRSRSASIQESVQESHNKVEKVDIPPMPFASGINESDITRTSLLTEVTERPRSRQSDELRTPVKEVSRYSFNNDSQSPSSRTPTQSTHQLGHNHGYQSYGNASPTSPMSPMTPESISTKARIAALAAAGLGAARIQRNLDEKRKSASIDATGSPRSAGRSPAQSVSSIRDDMRDPLVPQGLRPRSRLSHTTAGAERDSVHSETSAREAEHEMEEHLRPVSDVTYDDPGTPRGEEMEEWFQKQHEENERYRQSIAGSSLDDPSDDRRHTHYTDDTYSSNNGAITERDIRGVSAQPQIVNEHHAVESAVASLLDPSMLSSSVRSDAYSKVEESSHDHHMEENLRDITRASPAPHEIAAVAVSEEASPVKSRWSALREQAEALSGKNSPGDSDAVLSKRDETRLLQDHRSEGTSTPIKMGASGLPLMDDPLPEIGHGLDDVSEISTNPPEIHGAKPQGDKERWSYDTDGFLKDRTRSPDILSPGSNHHERTAALLGAGKATGGTLAAEHLFGRSEKPSVSPLDTTYRNSVEDAYNRGPTPGVHQAEAVHLDHMNATPFSPNAQLGDEGYSSAAHARSPRGERIKGHHDREFTPQQLAEYEAAMGPDDEEFLRAGTKHARHYSANSHGLASPPYDSATGKGIDRIQSEDVVALMDHLTVRDAQRNARDTEILVTLVRSAAEMRQEFDALKKFIAEEDRMIMKNTDRDADITVQKVLSGPRPMPAGAVPARSPRGSYDSEESATKRKNIFKRALKGLSSRNNNDLARIEDMLNQLLGDVEVLKVSQGAGAVRPPMSLRTDSLDSYDYEERRAGVSSGYEPEGEAGTSSTPNQSGGQLSLTPTKDKHFHSGYDGRRGSVNRVSTVMEEGDEDESYLNPHEEQILDDHFEGNPRLLTPTQESYNKRSPRSIGTPPQARFVDDRDRTPERSPEQQRKHKSTSSSLFGIPKFSRWSKTTASTDQDYKRKSYQSNNSKASRSGDSIDKDVYNDDDYRLRSDDRLRSTQSLAREQNAEAASLRSGRSTLTRTPSPLLPSENGSYHHEKPLMSGGAGHPSPNNQLRQEDLQRFDQDIDDLDAISFDDPKYQAYRNSLLLQHPQPRPGPTHRHQTNLESQARTFSGEEVNPSSGLTDSDLSAKTTDSDFDPAQWGSNPSLSLARTSKVAGSAAARDDGPLIPQAQPSARQQQQEKENAEAARRRLEEEEEDAKNKQPRHAYDRMYYSSPLGSGHLLEPIPEVRYSLETDSRSIRSLASSKGHRSPDPSARPSVATNSAYNNENSNASTTPFSSPPTAQGSARKITGPRPMGSRSPSKEAKVADPSSNDAGRNDRPTGTVRRKPVASGAAVEDETSWGSRNGRQGR